MEQTANETMAPKRLKAGGKKPLVIIAGIVIVVLAAYLALCAYAADLHTTFPGMRVEMTPVGGMTVEEIEALFTGRDSTDLDQTFTLYLTETEDTQMLVCDPFELSYADLGGVTVDAARTAQRAYDYCHEKNFFQTGWRYLECLLGKGGVWTVNTAPQLSALAPELAEKYSRAAIDTSYALTEDGISVTVAQDGYLIDPGVLADSIQARLAEGGYPFHMDCPTTDVPAKPLTAQEIYDEVSGEMKNAGYDAATGTIIPEQMGAEFDVDAAQQLLDAAAPGETIRLDATIEYPTVTAEKLKGVLFRDVLGECTTKVGGTAARISNVKLASSAVNGTVLNSGDVFSYNGTTGQRTAAKGYQAAPAYVQGETVDEIGGGVCQPSSTLYLACLRANLEITERYAHRYVPSYITPGMDATVSWGGPDYKFTNDTDYPIKIVATYSKGYLTMKLLGTKVDDTTVKMTNEKLSTTPFKVVEQEDPTLAPGTQEVKVTPYTGYKYKTYRNLYDGDGNLISSTYEATSDYKVRDKVILKGPALPAVTVPDAPASGTTEIPAESGTEPPVEAPPETTPSVPDSLPETPIVILPGESAEGSV
ncbi:Vancomycin resistance protein YoaR, contains peptidoglycan-binding and VanW domains [Oscillibacter sp. PC13]|uniref:VanW family protein n=1 Tax=Oscillibacter sp. PC13 TaxID=1855299 RepID=UPI0008F01A97|nr:VanW family protein [Oscillibacter sp. PC13]SFP78570.1 Vancomycin resistance protein YoaR, contains peptidoglycan-binding and VanW domains [Oscillibacter sp. PC13]